MRIEYQILLAFLLDVFLGDPEWLPHPVKLIGRFAMALEAPMRRTFANARLAGILTVAIVLVVTGGITFALIAFGRWFHPTIGDAVSIILLYTTIAARDLARHSFRVYCALAAGDVFGARKYVARLVGRDTERLDERETVRATVESVAENLVDGVTAPLFFAVLGGPVGAMLYKAVSTLDSTFGYQDERYLHFGWASARLDDLANYVPARLTAWMVPLVATLPGGHPELAARVLYRDGRKHPSPNAGLAEAAMAGALGVQLGGLNYYNGEPHHGELLGDPVEPLHRHHILKANRLMYATAILSSAVFLALRWGFLKMWSDGRFLT